MDEFRLPDNDTQGCVTSAQRFLWYILCTYGYRLFIGLVTRPQESIWGNLLVEYRFIKPQVPISVSWGSGWDEGLQPWEEISQANLDRYNVYFGVCPRLGEHGKAENVPFAGCLWADLDAKAFPDGKEGAWAACHKEGLPEPSFIIDSGHGYHLYWLLKEAYMFPDSQSQLQFRGYLKGIGKHIGGDTVHDVARMMRLPNTTNWKDPTQPVVSRFVEETALAYSLTDFQHLWVPVQEAARLEITFDPDLPVMDVTTLRVSGKMKQLIRRGAPKGQRSEACFKVIAALLKGGYSPTEIKAVMKQNKIGGRYYE
jgi:hypothetical protein